VRTNLLIAVKKGEPVKKPTIGPGLPDAVVALVAAFKVLVADNSIPYCSLSCFNPYVIRS